MTVEITPLAQKKLKQRGIPEAWVRETVKAPGEKVPGYGARTVYQRIYTVGEEKEQLLRVVSEEKESEIVVITAYLTSEIKRYWRAD